MQSGRCRCGKTPLSIYLGQRGYKVANLPLVPGAPLPPQLFAIDQHKVVALSIDPGILSQIRAARVAKMGTQDSLDIDYAAHPVRNFHCHLCPDNSFVLRASPCSNRDGECGCANASDLAS